ncbi:MAG: extracellular solute-binding protein [Anaerolineae bacterium]|nr:extracellular solute-binding protein [Anaerolineae bacterium]
MKRSIIAFLLVAMMVTAMLPATTPTIAQEDGLLIWADATRAPALLGPATTFAEEYGIPVEVQEVGMGDIRSNISVVGPEGEGPDIFIAAHDWIGEIVLNGSAVPINLGPKADLFTDASKELFTYNGELYGVPYATENLALVRNPELVPDAPATWDDVYAITADLVASGASQYGFIIRTNDGYDLFSLMSGFGGYVFGRDAQGNYDPNDVGIDSEGTIAAGEYLKSLVDAGYLVPEIDYDVEHALFEAGDVAMLMTGPWALPRIQQSGIPYAISNIPAGPAGEGYPFIGGQGFMVSAYSEKQLLAEAFLLDFMADIGPMQAMYDVDPRIPAFIPLLESLEDADLQAFVAAGENGVAMPSIPEMASVWSSWGGAEEMVIMGELDPQTAFTDAAVAIRDLIAGRVSGETASETGEYVGLPGTIQTAAGCAGDWDPACEATRMVLTDYGIWVASFELPAGDYEYKAALNGTWDENYGAGGVRDGDNIVLSLAEDTMVKFYYDPVTHWITDNVTSLIVTAPGSYQAAMGCPNDWAPECLLSWLQDPDGDGVFSFTTTAIPAGDYEVKAAANENWSVNWGADGSQDGPNLAFSVPEDGATMIFEFDSASGMLTVIVGE